MPDRRTHRGKHPRDDLLFAADRLDGLRAAVAEHSWLLSHGYARDSALRLVGDRHDLTARQRTAVMRSACSDGALQHRRRTRTTLADAAGRRLGIDGYNLLITVESALSGGLILIGRDDCRRDLASIHGTYRKVSETIPAIELIAGYLARHDVARIDWYLDSPVSNSGRLKAVMAEVLEQRGIFPGGRTEWNIELVADPDALLADYDGIVATSDSAVLDRCQEHVNLAGEIIDAIIPGAWQVDLR